MPAPLMLRRIDLAGPAGATWSLRLLDGPAQARLERPVQASVPGCVHTDLMAAGLLEDPYLGSNELDARWIGECSWRYTGRFEVDLPVAEAGSPPEQVNGATELLAGRADLVFDGIDTLATIRLNGVELGVADNMHATWRFDVRQTLRRGANEVEIDFPAPLPFCRSELERYRREIGDFPYGGAGANPQLPHHMLRKMHCNFGWDWGPQLVTCGIWRGVRIEAWDAARIASVRPRVLEATGARALVKVDVGVALSDAAGRAAEVATLPGRAMPRVEVEVLDPDGVRCASGSGGETIEIASPRLWWPAGLGDQPLYRLVVSLRDPAGGALLDGAERKLGLRTFEWVTTPDTAPAVVAGVEQPAGATFHLRVNGRRVFCKGANWIPDDCFPHRVTRVRYRRRVGQAREANMNMLRVWGGGIYEDDAFYDACDELGVMVWQDFATACTCYPEDEAFRRRFEHEARDNVARLAGRASLALWCGGNECIQATFDWGPEYRRMREVGYGWGRHYWYELFPRIVAELDPGTTYWPNSPWSEGTEARRHAATEGAEAEGTSNTEVPEAEPEAHSDPSCLRASAPSCLSSELPANLEHVGDQHIWDVWNGQGDWRNYWSHVPRFASEFGFHGPPAWPTLEQAIPPDQRHWFSPAMVLHNKQEAGQERAINRARDHFRLPERPESAEAFEAMWFAAALNQARALEAGCAWFRSLSPWCGGALYWQLNDCWPVASWSAIDNDTAGRGRPKLLWYATRRFFAPRMCALLPGEVTPIGHEPARPRVVLHNDHPDPWQGELLLQLADFGGRVLAEERAGFDVEAGGVLRFIVPGNWPPAADRLIVARATGAPVAHWFFGRDRDLPYPAPRFRLDVDREGADTVVHITAETLVRDLCLFPERLDPEAAVDEQLLTLLPGESATVRIAGASARLTAGELSRPGIAWCANALGAGA